jgi:glycine rich protein
MLSARTGRVRGWAIALVEVAIISGVTVAIQVTPAKATTLATFKTPGVWEWTVPRGVTQVTFHVYGAQGGSIIGGPAGGLGGRATATFNVKPGWVYEIVVGGSGDPSLTDFPGLNGGGAPDGGGWGGGASDVRIGIGAGNRCVSQQTANCGLPDRLVVGGGGGGPGAVSPGGNGGGLSGADISSGELGGRQEAIHGSSQPCPALGLANILRPFGCFGRGGNSSLHTQVGLPAGGGGGGGGWYGGDGALYDVAGASTNHPGAGGSSFISRFAVAGSFLSGIRHGNGLVIVTTA